MIRRFVDALAFAGLVAIGCVWSATAFGQFAPVQQPTASGARYISAASNGTTAGATATMASNQQGMVNYLCGFSVSSGSATAAITINIVTSGLPVNFTFWTGAPVTAVGTTGAIVSQTFTPCVPALAVNQQISVSAGALGAGGVNQSVNIWGYQVPYP